MKKLFLFLVLLIAVSTLAACDMINNNDPNDIIDKLPDDIKDDLPDGVLDGLTPLKDCNGYGDYIVIEGICYPMNDILHKNIQVTTTQTIVNYTNGIELMSDYVADLSGSTGLAVVDRAMFERQNASGAQGAMVEEDPVTETDNLIVKLTEEGFFEEVSFTDDTGFSVQILANPLALEVYGEFTVVIFEVDQGWYNNEEPDFNQKVWNSYYAGGIYLIHNETGKLFSTKEIVFEENTWTDYYYQPREITITAELNQPIKELIVEKMVDDNGNPILDENGNEIWNEIEVEILDSNGNPIIFTESPYQMEIKEIQKVEYFEKQVLDENENPVVDENGNPVMEIVEVPVLDDNGNPIFETVEVPVLDENGEPIMMQFFEVKLTIDEKIETVHTENYARITDNALTPIAEKFIQKVMEEYYNWNYYRVSNYQLYDHTFTYTDELIYFVQWVQNTSTNTQNRVIKKMYFDDVTEEIIIENYVDITKAGFDNCQLFVEPINGTIICDNWEDNIKIYSSTNGLKTLDDTERLRPIILPNGELFFYDDRDEYVEELGYSTTKLYTINPNGTLNFNYVELGEKLQICVGDCRLYFKISYMNEGNNDRVEHIEFDFPTGSAEIANAEAYLLSLGAFDSTRPVCEDPNGCYYTQNYQIVDENGTVLSNNSIGDRYYPGETPPSYSIQYLLDSTAIVQYKTQSVREEKVCTSVSELGCSDNISLRDNTIGNGIHLYETFVINNGDPLLNDFQIDSNNTNGVYSYTKTINGVVCGNTDGCQDIVDVFYYIDGKEIVHSSTWYNTAFGDVIPVQIEYHNSDATSITPRLETCQEGYCQAIVTINTNQQYYISYEYGEEMLLAINYVDTDKTVYTTKVFEREYCTVVNGCYYNDTIYEIVDENDTVLYTFIGASVDYGEKAPFKAKYQINDITVNYEYEYVQQDVVCENTVCYEDSYVRIQMNNGESVYVHNLTKQYSQGEKIVNNYEITEDKFVSENFNNICTNTNGCYISTNDFSFFLEDGTEVTATYDEWQRHISVFFEFGEIMPVDDDFHVNYELRNLETRTYRISPWEFINGLERMSILDDNLYLLEKNSWIEGEYNYILEFNELTGRYRISSTNMATILEITKFNDTYIAINEDKTAILQYTFNSLLSDQNIYYFDEANLTSGLELNGVNDLIVNYDGSIYFKGVDNFLNDITGYIDELGIVNIDTEYNEPIIVRVRPIN